mmetsp:Transcript_92700/g.193748  ORF Transcript_92700/g.193748 Transcript_92700/m.193748 type:complete len:157 (+) Transcript_92700:2-472(+)
MKTCLVAMAEMDYCQVQVLREWTLAARFDFLGSAPPRTGGPLHTFFAYVFSGHRLAYEDRNVAGMESTHGRNRASQLLQQRWHTRLSGQQAVLHKFSAALGPSGMSAPQTPPLSEEGDRSKWQSEQVDIDELLAAGIRGARTPEDSEAEDSPRYKI